MECHEMTWNVMRWIICVVGGADTTWIIYEKVLELDSSREDDMVNLRRHIITKRLLI